jgi:hypothetical protein
MHLVAGEDEQHAQLDLSTVNLEAITLGLEHAMDLLTPPEPVEGVEADPLEIAAELDPQSVAENTHEALHSVSTAYALLMHPRVHSAVQVILETYPRPASAVDDRKIGDIF